MMTLLNGLLPFALDPNEIALRGAEAAERTALYTLWLAIGTFGLLVGAIAAAIYAGLTWKSTKTQLAGANEQLEMARLANKQREAENVSAWLFGRGEALALSSLNANTGPIYNVRFEVFFKPNRATLEPSVLIDDLTYMTFAPAETLDQTQSLSSYHPDNYVYVKTDDGKELNYVGNEVVPVRKRMDFRIWDGKSHTTGFAVRMSFRDSAGVRWQRDWTGKLTEIKEAS